MIRSRRQTLPSQAANYLRQEIAIGTVLQKKNALHKLHRLLHNGYALSNDDRLNVENATLGVLNSSTADEKVRRWALVIIAHIGSKENSFNAVKQSLRNFPEEPQVLAAAIAALFTLDRNEAPQLIAGVNTLSPDMITMAALQSGGLDKVDLGELSIDIETASPLILQQSLLLVGLGKAPENIWHPKYSNGAIVKILGAHDEAIVIQYSVWAIASNPELGVDNLGIELNNIEDYAANIRSYTYQLFSSDLQNSSSKHEIICLGSQDTDLEARLGLSIGIFDNYYDGLETVTIDWFHDESDPEVQSNILDHFVVNSERLNSYEQIAIEQYESASGDSKKRQRMEASAAGTGLFSKFKQIVHQEDEGLFGLRRENKVTNYTINNNGSIGAISNTGNAKNDGLVQVELTQEQRSKTHEILEEMLQKLPEIPLAEAVKTETTEVIQQTQKQTNKENIDKLLSLLNKANAGLETIAGMASHAKMVGAWISTIGTVIV